MPKDTASFTTIGGSGMVTHYKSGDEVFARSLVAQILTQTGGIEMSAAKKYLALKVELVVKVEPEDHYTQKQLDERLEDAAFLEKVAQAVGTTIRISPERITEMDENGYLYVTDLVAQAVLQGITTDD